MDSAHGILQQSRRALVIGDVMLDVYTQGESTRLSPEAPVPVVLRSRRRSTAGGAGNAAANLAALGDEVILVGTVGEDVEGDELVTRLVEVGIDVSALIRVDRPTTCKHRVLSAGQQLVRIDAEDARPMRDEIARACVDRIRALVHGCDYVVISDYGKGCCSEQVCQTAVREARACGVPVVVDPKGRDYSRYRQATVVTPNLAESRMALDAGDMELVDTLGWQLVDHVEGAILVTRGAGGVSLYQTGEPPMHLPTEARSVFDVTGAGDTVAAVLGWALARRVELAEACRLANRCAGAVVGRLGTSAVTVGELREAIAGHFVPSEAGSSAVSLPTRAFSER